MNASAEALIGYAAWTLTLLMGMGVLRSALTVAGKKAANEFRPDGTDLSPFAQRLTRAHANCYENLPAFAAIVLVALATGNAAITDPLACWALGARIAQSCVHLSSTSVPAVMLRFALFAVQLGIQVVWLVGLFGAL